MNTPYLLTAFAFLFKVGKKSFKLKALIEATFGVLHNGHSPKSTFTL